MKIRILSVFTAVAFMAVGLGCKATQPSSSTSTQTTNPSSSGQVDSSKSSTRVVNNSKLVKMLPGQQQKELPRDSVQNRKQ